MDKINVKLIEEWIKELEPSLPKPIEEIDCIILKKAHEENVSDEFIQIISENLEALNILKITKEMEVKIEQILAEIKVYINDKRYTDLASLLELINDRKETFFRDTELEIRQFSRTSGPADQGNGDIGSQVSKFEREIFKYLKSSSNKIVVLYMRGITQKFSETFEDHLRYLNAIDKIERQQLDFNYECTMQFENKLCDASPFTPIFLRELFIEEFIEFLHSSLLKTLDKEVDSFLSNYRYEVSQLQYFMNSEEKLHKKNALIRFNEDIRQKYGWIPDEFEIKIMSKVKRETNKIWRENGFDNSEHLKIVGKFAEMEIARIINGELQLFQNGQQNSQEFKLAALKILWEASMKTSDCQIFQLKIREIEQFISIPVCAHLNNQNPQSIFIQSKENMYFFLLYATLVASNLHYVAFPEFNNYEKRESQVEDFEWLRIILGLSFKFYSNHPTKCVRQDNPMIICKKMLEAIANSLYKARKLNKKTDIHKYFSESVEGYMHCIQFQNIPRNEPEIIRNNFTKIKEGHSAVITICISGWLSSKDDKHEDWFHVGELPCQGLTYDFKWNAGDWIDLSLKVGFNVLTWLPLPLGFRWYSLFGQGVMKRWIIGSGLTSLIKRPLLTRFRDFIQLSREDPLIPISSTIDYFVGSPFEGKAREAENAGKLLAQIINNGAFENSKINLICFSLAAEVVRNCLMNISEEKANIINHVIIMGGASSKNNDWAKCKQVVNGRMICVYCKTDYTLKYLYRASQLTDPIGLNGIDVKGVENFDATKIVSGHLDYRDKMDSIFYANKYFGA